MILPKISPARVVYQTKYQKLVQVTADFGEYKKEYTITDYHRRVAIVLIRNTEILLVRQYRLLINDLSWEIPGGKIEEGEQPEEAIRRETFEETGFLCKSIKPLLFFHLGLEITFNPTYLFYCSDFEFSSQEQFDPHEIVQLEWISIAQTIEMIFTGHILDTLTILALLAYQNIHNGLNIPGIMPPLLNFPFPTD